MTIMIPTPVYCPKCRRDSAMTRSETHLAFECPEGHLIAVIDYIWIQARLSK